MGKMSKSSTSPYGWEFIDDLSALTGDESAIVEFLLHRLGREEIYTWVGPLLLAINPEKLITRDLYDEWWREIFTGDDKILQKPRAHIYAVASRAQYSVTHGLGKVCQVIIISGESGTGKTFNARKALNFLAATNQTSSGFGGSPELSCILRKIGNVFPLLSAFTTASTENNARSSRHGQLLRLQYDKSGVIRGACIRSFLLERTRVTAGSNNFEIFYQLIVGLSDRELDELRLSRRGKYAILGDCGGSMDARERLKGFWSTLEAFETLGLKDCKMDIFRVIAFLMHLGNIKLIQKPAEGCTVDPDDKESGKALGNACSLVSLPEDELIELLTSIRICPQNSKRRHSSYRRELKTTEDCRNRLFSIIRYLYERLFQWIVDRVNDSLTANGEHYDWLGILDIFGFESFETNGLEQLCINYSTERLQLYFMEDYLEVGQRELEEENLSVPPSFAIQFYRERISAIEAIVFTTFNDACRSSISPCLSGLRQQLLSKEKEVATRFLAIKKDEFVIKHYSRTIAYSVDNLLSKNTDKVPTELSSVFERCNNSLLRSLSKVEKENVDRVSPKQCTALAKLKRSLDDLLKELNKCDSHYVRCTRPRQVDGLWLKNEFREQLACTGILDALPLAKCKFPIRFTFEEFYKRYSIRRVETDFNLSRYLSTIVNAKNVDSSMHLGKRLLFVTESFFLELENYRQNHRSRCAKRIQKFWLETRKRRRARWEAPRIALHPPTRVTEENAVLNNISPVSVEVNAPSRSWSEEGDVFSKSNVQLAEEDQENNNNSKDNAGQNYSSITIARMDESRDFPVPSTDGGYGARTIDDKPFSRKIVRKLVQLPHNTFKTFDKRNDIEPYSEIDGWKEFYLRKWLETAPTFAKESEHSLKFRSKRIEFFIKCSQSELLVKDLTLVINADTEFFFYRNRILSRRRPVEVPIKFHTRLTCISGSHRLPCSMKPRGLQDCLSEKIEVARC